MGWEFAVVLFGALLLTGALSWWQLKRYTTKINRLAKQYRGPGRHLVSGRHKGRLSGAIAVLVVDADHGEVIAAETMTGIGAWANLRPAPALVGSLAGIEDRAPRAAVRKAVADALRRLPADAPSGPAAAGEPGTALDGAGRRHEPASQPTPSTPVTTASGKVRITRRAPARNTGG